MNFPVTGAMLILIVTVGLSLLGLYGAPQLLERNLFRPYWLLRKRQYITVLSSGFMHADLMHLLFNMMTFYFFAFPLERYIGTTRFMVLYLLALIVSHAGTYYKQKDNPDYASVGASGAIAAVLFASIVYAPGQSLFIIPIPVPIPAPLFALGYLAYSYWASKNPHGRINHDAHLGGAITGLAFVALTDFEAYERLFS